MNRYCGMSFRGPVGLGCLLASILVDGTYADSANSYNVRFAAVRGDRVGDTTLGFIGDRILSMNDRGQIVFDGAAGLYGNILIGSAEGEAHSFRRFIDIAAPQFAGEPLSAPYLTAVNSRGQVAFDANFGPHRAVSLDDRVLVSSLDQVNDWQITGFGYLDVNDHGQVVAWAYSPNLAEAIFLNESSVVVSGDTIDGFTLRGLGSRPAINNSGTIAFQGTWATGSGVFTQDRKIAATGDIIDGLQLLSVDTGVTINNSGDVAFFARFAGGHGLFSEDHVLVKTGDLIDGRTITSIWDWPEINDRGEIVFTAEYDGGVGVFTRDHLIASAGDVIDGRALVTVGQSSNSNTRIAINNFGEIAFHSYLDGGSFNAGILIATPIPEPSASALALVAVVMFSCCRILKRARHR